jgi:hypothetical protein
LICHGEDGFRLDFLWQNQLNSFRYLQDGVQRSLPSGHCPPRRIPGSSAGKGLAPLNALSSLQS